MSNYPNFWLWIQIYSQLCLLIQTSFFQYLCWPQWNYCWFLNLISQAYQLIFGIFLSAGYWRFRSFSPLIHGTNLWIPLGRLAGLAAGCLSGPASLSTHQSRRWMSVFLHVLYHFGQVVFCFFCPSLWIFRLFLGILRLFFSRCLNAILKVLWSSLVF